MTLQKPDPGFYKKYFRDINILLRETPDGVPEIWNETVEFSRLQPELS